MIDLRNIPASKEDLDSYEVEHNFQSWSYQPAQSPLRVVSAKGVRFVTEDGRERLDFSSCFVSHNIGHQDVRVTEAISDQAKTVSPAKQGATCRPPLIAAMWNALARPLKESARASEMTCPP